MVKAKIKKFCYKAIEWQMLKIYATIMTGIFLCVWITAMVAVVNEALTYWGFFR